jgi:glycosyltransferase involved in cell wall biosynthesis
MIVKNEERNLARCLESVAGLCDELVVVDTGSTDNTSTIAKGFGCRVDECLLDPFDFSQVRNYALSKATGEWVLSLDADETLRPESAELIMHLIAGDQNTGYCCTRHNHGGYTLWMDYVVRLFPNKSAYQYRGRVHETIDRSIIEAGDRLMRACVDIDHWDFGEARIRKNSWYMEVLQEELADDPTNCQRLAFLASGYHQMGMLDEAGKVAERIAELMPGSKEAQDKAAYYRRLAGTRRANG